MFWGVWERKGVFGWCKGVGMFGMRKFRYRYTGKNIPVIPVYRYFDLCFIGSSES